MKKVLFGAVLALVGFTQQATAEFTVIVRGKEYPLVSVMDSCVEAKGGTEAQLKCFLALTSLVKEQSGADATNMTPAQALDALRSAAEHQDADSGLLISGSGCNVTMMYYNNYFHMSRRNVSSIDLFSTELNAAQLELDQVVRGQPGTASRGIMQLGSTSVSRGGAALESSELNFETKPASVSIAQYANSVLGKLPSREAQDFDFVMVHPAKASDSAKIWGAFEAFVETCKR